MSYLPPPVHVTLCRLIGLALVVLASSCGSADAFSAEGSGPRIRTAQGEVQGLALGEVDAFLGIPFAQAPTGDRRWRPPAEPTPWTGTRSASSFGAACMQDAPRPWGPFTAEFVELRVPRSEDCLFLNVWTPKTRPARGLPVFVWIHGGGYGSGAGSLSIYDGARLAARGAVVVSINYRVGVFGFLSHPALSAESPQKVSGNYGLLDMVAALRWLQANVQGFGGRPDQVTIAGQSAGASAVTNLLVMPAARGLFARAMPMSGANMGVRALSLGEAEQLGNKLLVDAGIASLSDLRKLPPEQVQTLKPKVDPTAGIPRLMMAPVVDGQVLPQDVETTLAPLASPVPVFSGYMGDEGFVMGPPPATPESFRAYVAKRYGDWADRFLAVYPHADDAQATASMRLIGRDRYMAALVIWAERRAKQGQFVQGYLFSRTIPGPKSQQFGAFHTGEVPYLFGVLDRQLRPFTDEDDATSRALQAVLLAFMQDGRVPKLQGPLTAQANEVLELGAPSPMPMTAVSTAVRLKLFSDYVAAGGQLSMF